MCAQIGHNTHLPTRAHTVHRGGNTHKHTEHRPGTLHKQCAWRGHTTYTAQMGRITHICIHIHTRCAQIVHTTHMALKHRHTHFRSKMGFGKLRVFRNQSCTQRAHTVRSNGEGEDLLEASWVESKKAVLVARRWKISHSARHGGLDLSSPRLSFTKEEGVRDAPDLHQKASQQRQHQHQQRQQELQQELQHLQQQ